MNRHLNGFCQKTLTTFEKSSKFKAQKIEVSEKAMPHFQEIKLVMNLRKSADYEESVR